MKKSTSDEIRDLFIRGLRLWNPLGSGISVWKKADTYGFPKLPC